MKQKSKILFVKGLSLLLALIMGGCLFAACGETPEAPQDSESETQSEAPIVTESETQLETESDTAAGSESVAPYEGYTYNLKEFSVIRPEGHDTKIGDAVSAVCEALYALGVEDFVVGDDHGLSADPARKEILIGSTNQPESAEAKALLSEANQYAISFYENKIVIQVLDNESLTMAVKDLKETFFSLAKDGVLSVKSSDSLVGTADFSVLTLSKNTEPLYNIVIPAKATETEMSVATSLMSMIEKFTGNFPELTYDDVTKHNPDTYSILVGNVNYPEAVQVKSELDRSAYAVRFVGKKLVVAGHVAGTLSQAGNMLLNKINASGDKTEKSVVIHVPSVWQGEEKLFLLYFPEFDTSRQKVDLDNMNKTMMLSYEQVKQTEFEAYYAEVEAMGYKLWQSNQIGANLFRTYRNDMGEIHLSYYPDEANGTMHIFTDRHVETVEIPDADPNYEKVTEATLHVMSLDYSHRTVYDGHGMNYIITLEDGRYIVMDGGYMAGSGSKDDERIYNYLVENNKRPDGKVVIAAWFMSHPHGDHFGAFESFVHKYKDLVTLEYFIANPYAPVMADGGSHWMLDPLPALLRLMRTPLIKPHTGQIITFCNTQLEVMYTHENLYPSKMYDTNNSSTVIRLKQNGHTALFTGDASVAACNIMVRLYGDELKSDIFQVNHHGCSGGTWDLYNIATREDSYVLWTCSKEAFYYRTLGYWVEGKTVAGGGILGPNRNLALKVGFDRCFYADGVVEQITFPLGEPIRISEERDHTLDPVTQPQP